MSTTLFVNGEILVMDGGSEPVDALIIRDGRVVASGAQADIEGVAGKGAEVVDLKGAVAMPGLIDTHPHMFHLESFEDSHVDLLDARDYDDIVARIRKAAASKPKGEWIFCTPVGDPWYFIERSYRDLPEGQLPDKTVLDHAAPDHPVFIEAWAPNLPNVCSFNSLGLKAVGINSDTPSRVGEVYIEKDFATGEPSGRLSGSVTNYYNPCVFWREIQLKMPTSTVWDETSTKKVMNTFNARGVTSAFEGHAIDFSDIDMLRNVEAEGKASVRVLAAISAEPGHGVWPDIPPMPMKAFEERLQQIADACDTSSAKVRIDGTLLSNTGVCSPGYMFMREPYQNAYGELTQGRLFLQPEKARYAMDFCAREGVRLSLMAFGDREHDVLLDLLDEANQKHDVEKLGWFMQHGWMMDAGHIDRYAKLGFDLTVCMGFVYGKGDMYRDRVGTGCFDKMYRLRDIFDSGMVAAGSSDWGPKNMFEQMELAVTHRFGGSGYTIDDASHRATRLEAVRMWTDFAAHVLRWPDIGSLQPGKLADMIVIDRNPVTCGIEDLKKTQVLQTYLDGERLETSKPL